MKVKTIIFFMFVISLFVKAGLRILSTLYYKFENYHVIVIQQSGNLKRYPNGVPVDRPFWYFLPFLGPDKHKKYQPKETDRGKVFSLPSWHL